MTDRILIVERDPTDETVWRYGIADEAGELAADAYRLPPLHEHRLSAGQ
jgi:hypothetical protein